MNTDSYKTEPQLGAAPGSASIPRNVFPGDLAVSFTETDEPKSNPAVKTAPRRKGQAEQARIEARNAKMQRGIAELARLLKENANPGDDYIPLIRAIRSHSHGYVYRVWSATTRRMMHLQSTGEYRAFNVLEQSESFRNIREGFGIPKDLTEAIAEREGIKHPYNRFARENAMMSCDFLCDLHGGGYLGIDYKPFDLAQKKRVRAKFKIMALALATVGIRHVEWTERNLDPVLTANLDLLYPFNAAIDAPPLPNASLMRAGDSLKGLLCEGKLSIYDAAVRLEPDFACGTGRLVRTALWMIARHHWPVDLSRPVHPDCPLSFRN